MLKKLCHRTKLGDIIKRSCSSGYKAHPLFKLQKEVSKNVYFIQERYFLSWNLANIFFIKGEKRDLLVDTGIGLYSLPAYLTSSGLRTDSEKPLDVVLTHSHFDHSGGAHQFEKVHVHEAESSWITTGNRRLTATWITESEVVPKPSPAWNPRSYRVTPVNNVQPVSDRHQLDLGDRTFSVLHLPGHSPGSIGLLDDMGVLVTGDTLYETTHGLIDWFPQSNCAKMEKSVELIQQLCRQNNVEFILPGHNQVLTCQQGLEAADQYLNSSSPIRTGVKRLSRARANTILALNSVVPLPNNCRDFIEN